MALVNVTGFFEEYIPSSLVFVRLGIATIRATEVP
jgi:hypothetical protein